MHSIQITLGWLGYPGGTQLVTYWSSVLVGFILELKVWEWVPFLNQMEQERADRGGAGGPVMETDWALYNCIASSWNWTLGLVPNSFENPNWMEILFFFKSGFDFRV